VTPVSLSPARNGGAYGRCTAPARQQGGVNVECGKGGDVEDGARQDLTESGHDLHVGPQLAQRGDGVGTAYALGLQAR